MQIMRNHSGVLVIRGLPFCASCCAISDTQKTRWHEWGKAVTVLLLRNSEELMGSRCSRNDGVVLMECIRLRRRLMIYAPSENPLTALVVQDTIHFPLLDADHARPFRGPCYSRAAIPVLRAVQFQTLGADGGTHGRKAVTVLLCSNGEELMGKNPLTALLPDTIHFPIFDADHARPFRGPCYYHSLFFVLCDFRQLEQTVARMGGTRRKAVTVILCVNGEDLMGSRCSGNDGVVLMECIHLRRRLMIYVAWCPDYVF
ncbi:hypothetical protein CEXT_676671 [Caerostris extrusa]|uniref:Uncharacterized protein n=1 Tax=Caerostris extrusa TaxID=172846 RepID=A0AAV4TYM3_CAEEX|nr:hypothetical protein CEXT_676671 [Caerostris extrusa]